MPAEDTSHLHERIVNIARSLGIAEDDIIACPNNAELQTLIRTERERIEFEQRASAGRGAGRSQVQEPAPAPAPPPDEDWNFEEDLSFADDRLIKEIKRVGKTAKKASANAEIAELKKLVTDAVAKIQAIEAANHPLNRRADAVLEKYPDLFADEHGDLRKQQLMNLLFGPGGLKEQGRLTMVPEKDIPLGIAILFPGYKPNATGKSSEAESASKPVSREVDWSRAGQAPATNRNGASRTGIPGGEKAALGVINAHLRKAGLPVEDVDGDDDKGV